MSGVVEKMNTKYNPVWVKKLLAGATVGLFAYLLANQIQDLQMPKLTPAIISAVVMLLLTTVLKKYQRLQELALGISMLVGMIACLLYTSLQLIRKERNDLIGFFQFSCHLCQQLIAADADVDCKAKFCKDALLDSFGGFQGWPCLLYTSRCV